MMESSFQAAGLWGLFGSGFISSTLLPGGSEILLGWMLSQQSHTPWLLVLVATLGNTLGGLVTWGMGYWVAIRFPARALTDKHRRAQDWLQRFGPLGLLLSWLPIVGDPLCFVGGWLRLAFPLCLIFILLGKAARYALLAGIIA
jgi:membrane protein YqaA with SNARE-associated domain